MIALSPTLLETPLPYARKSQPLIYIIGAKSRQVNRSTLVAEHVYNKHNPAHISERWKRQSLNTQIASLSPKASTCMLRNRE